MKKHLKLFTLAVFAMVSLLFATASMAQTNSTGSVDGTVSDSAGAVVPNATVTISGPNLISTQTVQSDGSGAFRFLAIPPGRYTVSTAPVSGFSAFKRENVEVNLERTTTVAITLTTQVGEVVDVVASSEIDQNSNTTGSNISTEFFSNIPTSRTVQGLYTIAPTVARSGLRDASGRDRDPSVAGSSGPENSYILDGVTTTDPAFGGGGANLPFEFVQEVQIKTGSYGADQGLSTGGVFNVITKSGTNEFHGDVFAFFGDKSFVRETKNFPLTGIAPNGFSEIDAGGDIGGPIAKDKLWFFGAFNPQRRKNQYLTQAFRQEREGEITTPFYSGKLTWAVNNANTFTFSTFGDFTKEKGHLFPGSGFGANPNSFRGERETGGSNYAFRLNTNAGSKFIGEFSFGLHFQRNNLIPDADVAAASSVVDNYAILRADGTVAPVTQTGITGATSTGQIDFVYGGTAGGTLQRNFNRGGFSPILFGEQARDRWEFASRMQSIAGSHTFKYGFEFYKNKYDIAQNSTGPSGQFPNPNLVPQSGTVTPTNPAGTVVPDDYTVNGFRVTNRYFVCVLRSNVINCPTATPIARLQTAGVVLPAGITLNSTPNAITLNETINSPFLVRNITRVRDFRLNAKTNTAVQSFYFQDDYKIKRNFQVNMGVRFDFQQANGNEGRYLSLNNVWDNMQPRLGFIWDPFDNGKGKFFVNYARYVETPLPLDVNVRAGSNNTQIDKNFNVQVLNAPLSAPLATGFGTRNLGAHATPIDAGLKPQTVNEWTAGFEYEVGRNYAFGMRGIYRPQGTVIEDGSFDDGDNYFLFNPGEREPGNTEDLACLGDAATGRAPQCFGRARRYYRALEFTFNRRFANSVSFQSSYVFSSLTGNYEGLFRNDNGQADPNITSLFDLTSLLGNSYGRLPNDRPHQFKFNGSYQTPWKFVMSGNFYAQSGTPFNQLTSHPVYLDNEGFGVIRGTAIIPDLGANSAGVESAVGSSRSPTTMNLDLGFYIPFKFGETKQLRFTADWFNVFNGQRAVKLDESYENTSGLAGVPNILNPYYGSGLIFQYPSSFRLGAKFSF